MKNIILALILAFCFNAQAQYGDAYHAPDNAALQRAADERNRISTSTNTAYRSNTAHYNTFAPVNAEMTKEQIKSIEKLFGMNRKTQSELDSIYYANLKLIEKNKKQQQTQQEIAFKLKSNISSMTSNTINIVDKYFISTISFLDQNINASDYKCLKCNDKNGFLTYDGTNKTLKANVKNGIKNGGANIVFNNDSFDKIHCNFTNDEMNGRATVFFKNDKYDVTHLNLNFRNNKIIGEMSLFFKDGTYFKTTIVNNKVNGAVYYRNANGARSESIYHQGEFKTLLSGYSSMDFDYYPKAIYKNAKNEEIEWSDEATKTSVETVQQGGFYITTKTTSYGKKKPKLFVAWSNGRSYYGTFNGNKISGGTFVGESGWVYQGEISNDKFSGTGTVYWTDGSSYTGE